MASRHRPMQQCRVSHSSLRNTPTRQAVSRLLYQSFLSLMYTDVCWNVHILQAISKFGETHLYQKTARLKFATPSCISRSRPVLQDRNQSFTACKLPMKHDHAALCQSGMQEWLSLKQSDTCDTDTFTYTHTCIHTYTHTYIHMDVHTCTHGCTHVH